MAGPVITWIRNWIKPPAEPDVPLPQPNPAPAIDDPVIPAPSIIPAANYIRAFFILRAIPFKKLRDAFLQLPLWHIAYVIGCIIWVFMTYSFVVYFWRSF